MISAISGKLARVHEDRVTIEVGGLSYEILVSPSTVRAMLPRRDQEVRLETIYYIQGTPGLGNMAPVLVGFAKQIDKEFFEHFITVGGIGPRAALKALAVPAHRIARAIENEDVMALSSLPGIGRQKAAKIIAELKGKVTRFALAKEEDGEAVGPASPAALPEDDIAAEALDVLLQLGYKRQEAEEMVRQAMAKRGDVRTVEAVIQEVYKSAQRRDDSSGRKRHA